MTLRWRQLVPPANTGADTLVWSLTLSPQEEEETPKTATTDESVLPDLDRDGWMGPALRARQLDAPFMAGSSLPVCWRDPWLEHELETPLQEAVAVGFSGLDIYGFHTLEVLQCMFERRVGGETGVAAVTCLEGDDVWNAKDDWWRDLAQAARDAEQKAKDRQWEIEMQRELEFQRSQGLR